VDPASFYIKSPDNTIKYNRAAGSDSYGLHLALPKNSIGMSTDRNYCPNGKMLKDFDGNIAHSNVKAGLYQTGTYVPRTNMCDSITYDPSLTDPYSSNPIL